MFDKVKASFTGDKVLMRAKDIALLVGAIAGVISWTASRFYASPMRMEIKLNEIQSVMRERTPIIADMSKRITILEVRVMEQNDSIMRELVSINRKLGR